MYRIGVDIGGTFTDFTVVDRRGNVLAWKEPTTPDPARAIPLGLAAIAESLGMRTEELLASTDLFVHGTTIATNAVIQRRGPTVGLLATRGFRDILYLRDGFKPDRFNIRMKHPKEFVERALRLEITERIDKRGTVVTPLDEEEVRSAAAKLEKLGVESVAVAYLWAIENPAHEQRTAEMLEELLPDVYVVCGSEVLPEIREWERTSATALSAYILPVIAEYLAALEKELKRLGLGRQLLIMQINGGCASVREILRRPVYALASGPAAAPAAATAFARRADIRDLITVDMGGTSFDVCLISDGRAAVSRSIQVEMQPVGVAGIEVHSIGAGGGSIAWVDSGGALRVGPQSAGAMPGPACYDTGGTAPTVTDANVVLGFLSPQSFLGGRQALRSDLSVAAVERFIAEPLGLTVLEAAAGIIRVVNANMMQAIRAVSVERGIDPRRYSLVVGGGAGGLHAAQLARELGIGRILIPRHAGVFCSFGMTVTDVRHDYVRALHATSSTVDLYELARLFEQLVAEARDRLKAEGFSDDTIHFERYVDARYPGQVHELTISIPHGRRLSQQEIDKTVAAFHDEHRRLFTYSRPELAVEFLHWRVSGIGQVAGSTDGDRDESPRTGRPAKPLPAEHREVWIDSRTTSVAVYEADQLAPGDAFEGPAIVQSPTTTILVGFGDHATVSGDGSFDLRVSLPQFAEA